MASPIAPFTPELLTDFTLTIDGRAVVTTRLLDVINPATGQVFARCPEAGSAELDRAVDAARRAFPAWRDLTYAARAQHIKGFCDALRAHQESLARLLTLEQGKPIGQARDEIGRAATQSEGLTQIQIAPQVLEDSDQRRIELQFFALGVAAIITPWNAPINLAAGPMTSALYTGNTVILKPSPFTPLCTLKLGELAREHFPPGVVNVLAGGDDLGRAMTSHPGIDKIAFTGSVEAGKSVMANAAQTLKRVTLELGGNDTAIVLDDVDPKSEAPKMFSAS